MYWSAFAWRCPGEMIEWCAARVSFVGTYRGLLSTSDITVALSHNASHLLLTANAICTARGSGLLGSRWFLNR